MKVTLMKKRIIAGLMCVLMTMSSTPVFAMEMEANIDDMGTTEVVDEVETIEEVETSEESYNPYIEADEFISAADYEYEDSVEAAGETATLTASYAHDASGKPYGTISANYICHSDSLTVGTKVDVYYRVSELMTLGGLGSTFYEGCYAKDLIVTEAGTIKSQAQFDGMYMERNYKVFAWYTIADQEDEHGVIDNNHAPKVTLTDAEREATQDDTQPFESVKTDSNDGKMQVIIKPNKELDEKSVTVWVKKSSESKFEKYTSDVIGNKGQSETINLDVTVDYNGSYGIWVMYRGFGTALSNVKFPSDYNPKIDFTVYSKDGIGFFDVAYLFRLNPSTEAKKFVHVVTPYYYKTGTSRINSQKLPQLILDTNNRFEAVGTSSDLANQLLLEPNTDYTIEFEAKQNKTSAKKWTYYANFTTKNYSKESAKVTVNAEIDSASFDFEIPAGLTVDEKFAPAVFNRTGYLFVKKKGGTYSPTAKAVMNLTYSQGKWTASDVKVPSLEENTAYTYKLSFKSNGQEPILFEREFNTAQEPRSISINSVMKMYGGFSADIDVTDDIGEKMEVDDLYFAVKYPDSLEYGAPIRPKYNAKENKYSVDIPVDPAKYVAGKKIQYKAYFYDPSKVPIPTGIVEGEYVVPVDNRELVINKEKTYRDAHMIDLELSGLKSYNSYLSYFARKNGGEWKNMYVFTLNKKTESNKVLLVYTDDYEVGDKIDYVFGYVDDFTDAYNPVNLYGTKSGSFTVLSDDRSVVLKSDPRLESDSVTFNGLLTGAGRYMDYDYVKVFYREKGDSDTYSNVLVTLYPDDEEFEAIVPDLLPNTIYEYVIGVAGYANAPVDKLLNTPIKGEFKTRKDENSLTLSIKDIQPKYAISNYKVNGATVEIMYSDINSQANKLGLYVEEFKSGVVYSTSDSKVAAVNKDTGVVTIKKPGIIAITATCKRKSGTLILKIIDYKPLLQSEELRIYQGREDSSAFLGLIPQNGAEIEKVEIKDNVGMLSAIKKDEKFYIRATGYEVDTTELIKVVATLKDGSVYTYDMSVRVDVSVPDIDNFSIRQTKIPNVFYGGIESENAEFIFKSNKYQIESIESKRETDIYQVESYDNYTGKLVLNAKNLSKDTLEKFTKKEPIILSVKVKDYAKADLELKVDVRNEAPIITIDEAFVTEALGEACVAIKKGKEKLNANLMTLNAGAYEDNVANVTLTSKSGLVKVKLNNATSGKYRADVSMRTWTSKVVIEGVVKYYLKGTYNRLKMVPSDKTLTINTNKAYNKPLVFTVSVKGSEKLPINLSLATDNNDITVRTTGTNGIEVRAKEKATGSAKITVNGAYAGEKLKPFTVKVKLTKDDASVKYSRKGKMNIADRANTYIKVTPKFKNVANDVTVARVAVTGAKVTINNKLTPVSCFKAELEDGEIRLYAKPGMTIYPSKKYQVTVLSKLSNGQSLSNDVVITPQNIRPKLKATAITNRLYKTNKSVTADFNMPVPSEYAVSEIGVQRKKEKDKMADNFVAELNKDGTISVSLKSNGARLKAGNYKVPVYVNIKDADNKKPLIVKCSVYVK